MPTPDTAITSNPRKFRVPTAAANSMSAATLRTTAERLDQERNALIDDMIDAGRGHWRLTDIQAHAGTDAACKHYATVASLQADIGEEQRRRIAHSGKLRRISSAS